MEKYVIYTITGFMEAFSFEELLEKVDFLLSKRFFTIESIVLVKEV